MSLEEARKLHLGDLVEIRSNHKGTLTAIYKVMGIEETTHFNYEKPNIYVKLELVAGSFIDHNGQIGKPKQVYGPGTIRHMRYNALMKIEDL